MLRRIQKMNLREEQEANEFAMCLLMPQTLLFDELTKFKKNESADFVVKKLSKKKDKNETGNGVEWSA
jgi:Zn-dependent peptidase ImmA (M78 family)